jgi:broad specificity phosphatase PhoE
MTKILLVRHGHVEGIEPKRFRGRADLLLTRLGRAQAEAVAGHIAVSWRPAVVYTSPLTRCIETGTAIARACELEVQVLAELTDIDYGAWQSRSYDEMEKAEPQRFKSWLTTPHLVRFPAGESLQDLVARSADALRIVLQNHPSDTVVLVSHDSFNRALLLPLLDQPLSAYWRFVQYPCCINECEVIGGAVQILQVNETHHLDRIREGAHDGVRAEPSDSDPSCNGS